MSGPVVLQFGSGRLLRGLVTPCFDAGLPGLSEAWRRSVTVVQGTGAERARAFDASGGRYEVLTRGVASGESVDERATIDAVAGALVADEDWAGVLEASSRDAPLLIASNTTEVGLKDDPADVGSTGAPRTFPARLCVALLHRYETLGADAPDTVVVPCELVEGAGDLLRDAVISHTRRRVASPAAVAWLGDRVRFCSSLVDRICVRAPEDAGILAVTCEPYRLWAIECPGGSNPDGDVGSALSWTDAVPWVSVVDDLTHHRERKLRLLNGTHTAFSSLALLAGFDTVLGAVRDTTVRRFVSHFAMEQVLPAVTSRGIPDAEAFAAAVLDRFANPHIEHRLRDIVFQHSTKARVRLAPLVGWAQECGLPSATLAVAVAGWIRLAEMGALAEADPIGERVGAHARGESPSVAAERVLSDATLWDPSATGRGFVDEVGAALGLLRGPGVRTAIDACVSGGV